MILPKDIKTRHKIRDAKILSLYSEGELNTYLIASKFSISQPRVMQIVKANAQLVLDEKDWNKIQRISLIKRHLAKNENVSVSPDKLLELWRKEFEGDNVINVVTQFLQIEKPSEVVEENNRLNIPA